MNVLWMSSIRDTSKMYARKMSTRMIPSHTVKIIRDCVNRRRKPLI